MGIGVVKVELSYVQHMVIQDALMFRIEVMEKDPSFKDQDSQAVISEYKETLSLLRKSLKPFPGTRTSKG